MFNFTFYNFLLVFRQVFNLKFFYILKDVNKPINDVEIIDHCFEKIKDLKIKNICNYILDVTKSLKKELTILSFLLPFSGMDRHRCN